MFRRMLRRSALEPAADPKPGERWQLAHTAVTVTVMKVDEYWVIYDTDLFRDQRMELPRFKRFFKRYGD